MLTRAYPVQIRLSLDMAEGMAFLHAQSPPMIHRDLKSLNILATGDRYDEEPGNPLRAKITDFGMARIKAERKSADGDLQTQLMTECGTPYWSAPEMFTGIKKYNEKVEHRVCTNKTSYSKIIQNTKNEEKQ